jgi:hypothetical protein
MALTAYETLTLALLQAPSSPVPLISTATLDSYINIARGQVAADGECIRIPATLTLSAGVEGYLFSSFTLPVGISNVIAVRSGIVGSRALNFRSWEYFMAYFRGSSGQGQPTEVAQQGQGSNGTLFFFPIPNAPAVGLFDTVCLGNNLTNDASPEGIPALWRDAVPFYAAWLAMMSLQRQGDAQMMMQRYHDLMRRARQLATPSELPENMPGGTGAQMVAAHGPLSGAAPTGQR